MNYQKELDLKLSQRKELIQSNIKDNTFSPDGSFTIKLDELNTEIGQLQDKVLAEI